MARGKNGKVSEKTFDDFLAEHGVLEPIENDVIKEIITEHLIAAMKDRRLTKSAMAARK
jgi:hypothetical protein